MSKLLAFPKRPEPVSLDRMRNLAKARLRLLEEQGKLAEKLSEIERIIGEIDIELSNSHARLADGASVIA